jgi:DNA/RNA-binding domain of Phe-tRNA-synthetase-like protein
MDVLIEPGIFAAFDTPIIGIVTARGVNNQGDSRELEGLLRGAEEKTRRDFASFESCGEHPHIKAWRKAYKKFGVDPHQYRCSAEALLRRVLKGDSLPHINNLVDIYNYISLTYVIPIGGEDMDKIKGALRLSFAEGTEPFIQLNGIESDPPEKGEIVYKDDEGVLCRRWNWREADRTKLTEETKNAIIVIDALSPMERGAVREAADDLAGLIRRFCGGDIDVDITF